MPGDRFLKTIFYLTGGKFTVTASGYKTQIVNFVPGMMVIIYILQS